MFNVKSIANAQSIHSSSLPGSVADGEGICAPFQNELERLQPFLFRCVATEIPLLTQFAQSLKPEEFTDIRGTGLKNARNGTFQSTTERFGIRRSGLHRVHTAPLFCTQSRISTPQYASVLQPQARKQLAELAASTVTKAPPHSARICK